MKTEKVFFKVVGMYCITCKPIVEKKLKNEEAVKKIDIDYMTDRIVVEFDSSMITKEEIKNKLENLVTSLLGQPVLDTFRFKPVMTSMSTRILLISTKVVKEMDIIML